MTTEPPKDAIDKIIRSDVLAGVLATGGAAAMSAGVSVSGIQNLPLAGCLVAVAGFFLLPVVLDFLIRPDAPPNLRIRSVRVRGALLQNGATVCTLVLLISAWAGVSELRADSRIKSQLAERI